MSCNGRKEKPLVEEKLFSKFERKTEKGNACEEKNWLNIGRNIQEQKGN